MKLLTLDYQGMAVYASREAWFNATEIAALFGKRPVAWLRLPETEQYIAALCRREVQKQADSNTGLSRITQPELGEQSAAPQQILKVRKSHFIKTKSGRYGGGTWLHPKLAVPFARWCDVDFSIWCDEQIAELLSGSHTWQAARTESKIAFQVMAEVIQASRQAHGQEARAHHYSNEALLCNAALSGQYKALRRDTLPAAALAMLTRLEAHNAALIAQGLPYETRKARVFALAAPVRCSLQAALNGGNAA